MSKSYKNAGVDLEAGYRVVKQINTLKKKNIKGVFKQNIGMFAGGFDISEFNLKQPILFSSTDGVGTKLKIALEVNKLDNIGQDLVAMCVNDLICHGAKPIYFLDYIGVHKINDEQINPILNSVVKTLNDIDCALIGGETAEMGDMYRPGELDLAGMATGICEKEKIILGDKIKPNNIILSLPSSGVHSNGFSLLRKIISPNTYQEMLGDKKIIDIILEPTYIYVNLILELIQHVQIIGLANNTGGGIFENLARCLPNNISAVIDENKIKVLDIFNYLEKKGRIPHQEMFNVFNMGMGFFIVIDKKDIDKVKHICNKHNFPISEIGHTTIGNGNVEMIWK